MRRRPLNPDSPAARLTAEGARALSQAELVAIVLGSATDGGAKALPAAVQLVTTTGGSVRQLFRVCERATELPPRDAVRLVAALELGRRQAAEPWGDRLSIHSPQDVLTLYAPLMESLDVEEFHVIALDAQHHVVKDITVSRGILDSALVHPREVFRQVLSYPSASIILMHNHPSGDATPSAEDRCVTSQLVAAGTLLGIPVRDHVIIGKGTYVSFAESGWLTVTR